MGSNLRSRAAGKEVATTKNVGAEKELQTQISKMQEQFQLAMPKGVEATQLVRDAITALRGNEKLALCEPTSVLGSLMTCAQLGLRVGVLGHAWVLPFYDKKSRGYKAQLILGYQGLVELAHRSGKVQSLIARTVYEKDEFDVSYGLSDDLVHKPFMDGDRGDPIAYYAVVRLITGGHAFVVMTKREAEAHKEEHAMARTKDGTIVGPWRDDFDAMAMKTCVIKLSKWMPKSTEMAMAIDADGGIRVDLSPTHNSSEATHHYPVIEGKVEETPDDTAPDDQLTVEDLHTQIAAAGEVVGMGPKDLEAKFGEQNEGSDTREASLDQLGAFLLWVQDLAEANFKGDQES